MQGGRRAMNVFALFLALVWTSGAQARGLRELPLPSGLLALVSPEGRQRITSAQYSADFFALVEHSVSQQNWAFCGPASASMVLNALTGIPRPLQPNASHLNSVSYAYFTQDNVFTPQTEAVVPLSVVQQQGLSLDELAAFLAAHPGVGSAALHSNSSSVPLATFRATVLSALSRKDVFAIVNFDRAVLKEAGGGHHSPLGAYHEASDSVLVMDVSRYKYSSWWVPVAQLYAATSLTMDSSTRAPRGLVLAWSLATWGPSLPGPALSTDDGALPVRCAGAMMAGAGQPPPRSGVSGAVFTGFAVIMLLLGTAVGAIGALWWQRRLGRLSSLQPGTQGPGKVLAAAGWTPVYYNRCLPGEEERSRLHPVPQGQSTGAAGS
ncbi:Phytochelatin synthase-domain-containing protein [Haematococcus lacustris]